MIENVSYARYENNPARQLAYQLWASQPDKPITEWIEDLEAAAGGKVALRTVQRWRHDDRWDERFAEEVIASSGLSVFEQVRQIRVAALPAIRYVDQVARGEVEPDRLRLEAAKFIIQQSAALHQHVASAPGPAVLPAVSLDTMSDAELLDYQDQLRNGSGCTSE